jgi:hypothetical protein
VEADVTGFGIDLIEEISAASGGAIGIDVGVLVELASPDFDAECTAARWVENAHQP